MPTLLEMSSDKTPVFNLPITPHLIVDACSTTSYQIFIELSIDITRDYTLTTRILLAEVWRVSNPASNTFSWKVRITPKRVGPGGILEVFDSCTLAENYLKGLFGHLIAPRAKVDTEQLTISDLGDLILS